MARTPQQKVAAKIAELVTDAPAGGLFHNASAVVSHPPTDDVKAPARFVLEIPTLIDYRMPSLRFEVTVTPLS